MTRWIDCRARVAALATGLAVLGFAGVMTATVAAADEVKVLNWKGWGTDEAWAVAEFEAMTGTNVVHDYMTSYPEAFAKLRTNPGFYDVAVMNAATS